MFHLQRTANDYCCFRLMMVRAALTLGQPGRASANLCYVRIDVPVVAACQDQLKRRIT